MHNQIKQKFIFLYSFKEKEKNYSIFLTHDKVLKENLRI